MKRITAALGAAFLWGSLLAPSLPANEIFEALAPPTAPADDDAASPSDLPLVEPDGYVGEDDIQLGCGCGPAWTITLGAIFLNRSDPSALPLVVDGPEGATLLDAGQFDFRTNWGFEGSLIRHAAFGTAWDLEGRYFGINQWLATAPQAQGGEDTVVLYANPGPNVGVNSLVDASYVSQLNSFELNGRRSWNDWLQWIAGVRYLELDERGLTINQVFDGGSAVHQINATNQLWGFQLGLDAHLLSRGRLDVSTFAKAGIFGNSADNSVVVTQSAGPTLASAASTNGASFAGELGVVGLYRLTDRWALRATYQLLWIDSVATAPNQVPVSDPLNGAASVDRRGDAFYQGGFLGAQFNW